MGNNIPIFRSIEIIEENIREKLTVEILADSVHFSKFHYQRLFREAVGDSVMAYVNRRRLTLAAEELVKTDSTVLEIALKYGYDSQAGFARSFKSHMGVTPGEYRKYRLAPVFFQKKAEKEKSAMMYSKATQEIIKELNGLIVQARETGAGIRKEGRKPEAGAFYSQFWNDTADRAEAVADKLEKMLKEITAIQQRPDEITARFRMIKTVEDTAFEASITAFQIGLMIARAQPEQEKSFRPLWCMYDSLARNARLKSRKTADFLNELAELIFQDMRKNAEQKIRETVEAGRAAGETLQDPGLPYAYLGEAAAEIAEEISAVPLEEVTCRLLEDCLIRLDIAVLAGDMDMFRAPSHKVLLEKLSGFREKLRETAAFFEDFSEKGMEQDIAGGKDRTNMPQDEQKKKNWEDLIFQEKILLFYLKGEIQKLGFSQQEKEQITALEAIAGRLGDGIRLLEKDYVESSGDRAADLIRNVYEDMVREADKMGVYGGPVRYIAEGIRKPVQKK